MLDIREKEITSSNLSFVRVAYRQLNCIVTLIPNGSATSNGSGGNFANVNESLLITIDLKTQKEEKNK